MRRELDEYLAPKPDECAPGEELSDESFLAMVEEIETAVTSSAMGYKSWQMLKEQLGACRVERGHDNYDRWKFAAMSVLRRKVEHDMEEEVGEEVGEEAGRRRREAVKGAPSQEGKRSDSNQRTMANRVNSCN